MQRSNHASGGKWEGIVGYSRVVRVGPFVYVSGTTAADESGHVSGDAYEQTARTLDNLQRALASAGARIEDVVRTRMFVKNIDDWEAVARAHGAVFGAVRPAATMVEVSRFITPEMLVEIEADAVVTS
ncbi:RidA family protein [Deinococcus yavapaiensis]|uniref:Enamine deaminase RidA (YjgF/YER057c/UK114 family) n=1 Tax=Deinococcus yavapaiensis KR-236 TaxID=694435 RepID=A0A318S6T0_9DEIO|nr:RidA family protein [Deinococcus yavapaiensis]PYE53349.1 enamine deaminase RidA (YjgF/YER057c/UK114 family) [Deinococcus yavapaiensis KR-236]